MDIVRLPSSRYIWGGLIIILFLALFLNLGLVGLKFEEPRRAIVALEMELSGNYLIPKINDFYYYNKPPIYNWILILFFKIFQSTEEWVVRMPTVVSFLLIAVINFLVVSKKVNRQMAAHSSLIFLTSTNLLFYFSFQGEIDMFYSLIVYVQITCLLHYFQKEDYFKLFIFSYILTGIGALTKGIPSLAFQAITILALFLYYKRFKALFSIWNFVGIATMIGIISGYFYLYSLQNDPLPMITRLITESSKRTLVEGSWYKSASNIYKFPLLLFTIILPWSLLIVSTKLRDIWKKGMANEWIKLCVIFISFNVVIYWLSPGTRDRYLYMFVPFISLVAIYLFSIGSTKIFSWFILLFEIVGLFGAFAIPFFSTELTMTRNLLIAFYLFIISGIFIYLYLKYSSYRVFQLVCYLLLARIAFNFLVMPVRYKNSTYAESEAEMLIEAGVNAIRVKDYKQSIFNPLIREDVDISLIEHPPYKLSFYYTEKTRMVLPYHTEEKAGFRYMATLESYIPSQEYIILDTISLNAKKNDYIIYELINEKY